LLLKNKTTDFPPVIKMPQFGWYEKETPRATTSDDRPLAWVCFYRAWYQTGDLAVIDCLRNSLKNRKLKTSPLK